MDQIDKSVKLGKLLVDKKLLWSSQSMCPGFKMLQG